MGTCSTVTVAWPAAPPARAVMVVAPFPADVTSPDPSSTPATAGRMLDHCTLTLAIALPCWSYTLAESCSVSPTDAKETSDGVTVTVVGTGGSTGVSPPPQA